MSNPCPPALVGDGALVQELVVLARADGQPVPQPAVVQGVHHLEHLPPPKRQALRRLLLTLKVGAHKEAVPSP